MSEMHRIWVIALLVISSGCAHLMVRPDARQRLWDDAHRALALGEFQQAARGFAGLAEEYPDTREGRESIFYLGTLHMDPRNPDWNPRPAADHLRRYLSLDTVASIVSRRPEASVLLQLAEQLNMPATERVPGLQPETRVVEAAPRIIRPEQCPVPADVEALRRQLAERDDQIRAQREELERIRRTLTPRP
jgi:hypothetical protein